MIICVGEIRYSFLSDALEKAVKLGTKHEKCVSSHCIINKCNAQVAIADNSMSAFAAIQKAHRFKEGQDNCEA